MSNWADDIWARLVGNSSAVSASAPGKILVAGGYLVLDSRYSGLVIAINARFTTKVALLKRNTTSGQDFDENRPQVILISPQYSEQPLTSSLSLDSSPISLSFAPRSNSFIEQTVSYVLAVGQQCVPNLASMLGAGLVIYTKADTAFYSELGADGVAQAKSGLGSSAALVSSVSAALLALFNIDDKQLCYRTAQLAHCAAQGKVGSGFDVSAAFFGSQIYRRFDKDIVAPYLSRDGHFPQPLLAFLQDDKGWSYQHHPVVIPEGVDVLLGDIRLGSQTPDMVKRVLEWRRTQSPNCWDGLGRLNDEFIAALQELRTCSVSSVNAAAQVSHDQWASCCDAGFLLLKLRRVFIEIRRQLREMGITSGVDIEPISQTSLLDDTMNERGVVCAGVPGAGGFDAIFAIYIGGESTRNRIQRLWGSRNVVSVEVQQDPQGIVINKD